MGKNFFGTVGGCEGFWKPQNLEVQVIALGRFYDVGVKVRDYAAEKLKELGFYTFRSFYAAAYQQNSGIYYKDEDEEESCEHEKFHEELHKTKYANSDNYDGLAFTYFKILNESLPSAFEYYSPLNNPGEIKVEDIQRTIGIKANWGKAAYTLCMNVNAVSEKDVFEKNVMDFISKSFCNHDDYNWLTLLMETQYFGLFGPCFDILSKYSNHEELFYHAFELLLSDPSGEEFIDYLNSLTDEKRGRLGVLFEKTVQKSILSFENENDKFNLIFIAPKEWDITKEYAFIREIEEGAMEKFGEELNSLGELHSKIWANHISIKL